MKTKLISSRWCGPFEALPEVCRIIPKVMEHCLDQEILADVIVGFLFLTTSHYH